MREQNSWMILQRLIHLLCRHGTLSKNDVEYITGEKLKGKHICSCDWEVKNG